MRVVESPRARGVLLVVIAGLALGGAFGRCAAVVPRDKSDPSPKAPRAASSGTAFPISFTIENPLNQRLETALIQGGLPFARGVLDDPAHLALRGASGQLLPLEARVLSLWPDGTTRWVEITSVAPALGPRARTAMTLERVDKAAGGRAEETEAMPAGVRFELLDETGRASFAGERGASRARGNLVHETLFTGTFAGRTGRIEATVTIARFPTVGATRYRFQLEELANGATWKKLAATVPQGRVLVYQQKEMGVATRPAPNGGTEIVMIDSPGEPVDRGVGRRWEVWGLETTSKIAARPLRPYTPADYMIATRAVPPIDSNPPATWVKSFDTSLDLVYRKRDANPRNFGWKNFGDFFDREHGFAYYGYLDQEYDPSTALWLAYVRTGRSDYFDKAESLADFFRDMCLSPEGATYQHRATVDAAYAHIVFTISAGITGQIRSAKGYAPTPEGLMAAVGSAYGRKTAEKSRKVFDRVSGASFEAKERGFVDQLAFSVVKADEERLKGRMAGRSQAEIDRLTLRDIMSFYAASPDLAKLGYRNVDEAFAPFFKRYGGSWDDFPAFHNDILPDPAKAHMGSHTLVEMLVWAYFFTGDEDYRDMALRAARYHVDSLIPRVVAEYGNAVVWQNAVESRNVGWPLISMMALWDLTEGREPDLHRRIEGSAQQLAELYTLIPVKNHQGGIHVGVGLEALCRYHEKTNDERVAKYIVDLARYWASTQWNDGRRAFNSTADEEDTADASITALLLYGIAYAGDLSGDPKLRARAVEIAGALEGETTNYAKRFAQFYRSTPRATAILRR